MSALSKYLVLAVVGFLSVTGGERGHTVDDGQDLPNAGAAHTAGTVVITWRPLARACQELSRQGHHRVCRPLQ
jgi:hypothetical protein